MKPQSTLCMTAMATAVAAAFTTAPAFGAQQIIGAGASAVSTSAEFIILADYCSTATNTVFYDNGTAPANTTTPPFSSPNGSIWRITCTPTTTAKFSSGLDVSYDTTGGSWKGLIAMDSANLLTAAAQSTTANPFPLSTVNLAGTTISNYVAKVFTGTFTFTYVYGAAPSILPSTSTVTFGLTDVEPTLFLNSYNEPEVNSTWDGTNGVVGAATPQYGSAAAFSISSTSITGTSSATVPYPAFGEIFGVAASPKLYLALQKDQSAVGTLPTSCVASTATAANTDSVCIPFISKAQYASLISGVNSFTAGTTGIAPLFTSIIPSPGTIEVARRDYGSGTQASSNAYFLGEGCVSGTEAINNPNQPVDIGVNQGNTSPNTELPLFYSYSFSTGKLISRLVSPVSSASPTTAYIATASNPVPSAIPGQSLIPTAQPGPSTGFVIGVVGASNAGSLTGGAGFLRLDGFYPNTANASLGLYNYVSTEHFYANTTVTGDAHTFLVDLLGVNGVPANETLAGFNGTGTVQYNAAASNYNNFADMCSGWVHK